MLADAVALSAAAVLASYAGEFDASDHRDLASRVVVERMGARMTSARTGDLVAEAVRSGGSVLAFNVITLEHAEGILLGRSGPGGPSCSR